MKFAIAVFLVLISSFEVFGYPPADAWERCTVDETEWYIDCVLIVDLMKSQIRYDGFGNENNGLGRERTKVGGQVPLRNPQSQEGQRNIVYEELEYVKNLHLYTQDDKKGNIHWTFKLEFQQHKHVVFNYELNYHRNFYCIEIEDVERDYAPGDNLDFYCRRDRLASTNRRRWNPPDHSERIYNTSNVYEGMIYLSRLHRRYKDDSETGDFAMKTLVNRNTRTVNITADPTVSTGAHEFIGYPAIGYGLMSLFSVKNGGNEPQWYVETLESFIRREVPLRQTSGIKSDVLRMRFVFRLYDKRAWYVLDKNSIVSPPPVPQPPSSTLTGDLNGDGVVNIADFLILAEWFDCETGQSPPNCGR